MNINLLVTTPLSFSVALPTNPTATEQAVHDALDSLGAEWVAAGESATRRLWCVITQSNDLPAMRAAIANFGLPMTVIAAQNAHKTPVLDANGAPVLDVDNNPMMELVVHDTTTKATLLNYMPDVVTFDPITMKETGRTPATAVSLPVWGGHEAWVV